MRGSQFLKLLIGELSWCSEHWCFEGCRSCLSLISREKRILLDYSSKDAFPRYGKEQPDRSRSYTGIIGQISDDANFKITNPITVCWGLFVIEVGDIRMGREQDMSVVHTLSNNLYRTLQASEAIEPLRQILKFMAWTQR